MSLKNDSLVKYQFFAENIYEKIYNISKIKAIHPNTIIENF